MAEKINLDNLNTYKKHDTGNMLKHLHDLPAQCKKAWQQAMKFELPESYSAIDRIIILGMGGSAIGGDLVSGLASVESKVPIIVLRDYNLPAFVDRRTLVIASSYSGNTEETLSAFGQALKTKAKKLALTTGGKLEELAVEAKVPVFKFSYKAQPRAALGYSILPLLCMLQKLGIVADKSKDVSEMAQVIKEMAAGVDETVPTPDNPAKQLAWHLFGCLPLVYGAGFVADVARRWKTQFNENSKAWAFHEVFPELNHNAVVGYEFPKEMASVIRVIMLRSLFLGDRTLLRQKITQSILEEQRVDTQFVDGQGNCRLSQMMSLVFFGDWVSYYLAILYGADPSPVKVISYLKGELAKGTANRS